MNLRNVRKPAFHGGAIRRLLLSAMVPVLISLPLLFSGPAPVVEAARPSHLVPFLTVILGWRNRNRVYRTVNPFIDEKRAYYDALHAKAQEQLAVRELGGLRENQVAAYVKVIALIQRERQATIDFAESEKKAAREEFIDIVQAEISNRMLASTPATRVLGALTDGVRSSQGMIDRVLDKLAGGGSGALADVHRARRIASRVTIAGQLIGGKLGDQIRAAGGRVVDLLDTSDIEAGLTQAREELGNLGVLVEDLQAQGYRPTATEVGQDVLVTLITGKEANPAVQAIVDMLVARSGRGGDFRERARSAIAGDAAVRCAVKAQRIRQVVLRLEMDIAGDEGQAGDESDLPTCEVIDLAGLDEAVAAAPTATPTVAIEASPTPAPAATEPAPAPSGELYTGALELARQGNAPVWEIVESEVVLEVIDGVLHATIAYTQRSTMRQGGDTGGVCNATFSRRLSGQGPLTSPVALEVHAQLDEVHGFDGTICDAVAGWKTTAEEDLIANLKARPTMSLEGDFRDGRFTGGLTPTPYTVLAIRADR
jgi:hypothetical protein